MKKRLLSILLTLCMALSLLPTAALAAENVDKDDYSFVAETGALTVKTNLGTTNWRQDTNIVGSGPSKNYTAVTSVTIDPAITKIGQQAFMDCTELLSLTFEAGSKPTTIGDSAFMNCSKLGAVTIPASVTRIEGQAFEGCGGLTSLNFEIGSGLKTIDERAFSGCSQLGTVTIPANVTTIGWRAFYGCTELTSLTFEAGTQLGTIPRDAFGNCKKLAAVEIPASVVAIGESAFDACRGMTSLTFEKDSKLASIDLRAFLSCEKLPALTLPAQVSNIDSDAFRGCTALKSVEFTNKQAPRMGLNIFAFSGGTKPDSGVTLTVPADGKGYAEGDWATNGYTKQFPADQQDKSAPAAPTTITFSFDGPQAGQLMGTTTAMEYMVLSNRGWKPCTAADMTLPRGDIEAINTTDDIQIRVAGAGYMPSSASQTIAITRANPPRELGTEDATSGTNGKITGTTTAMEYSLEHEFSDEKATAISCMDGKTTGLAPGRYLIRIKATGTTQSSETAYKRIYTSKIDVPVPTLTPKTFNGTPLTCDVSDTADYKVTSNPPRVAAGSYPVELTLAEPTTHKWASGSGSVSGADDAKITIQFIIEKAAATEHLTDAPAIDYAAETVATTTNMQWYNDLYWVDCTAGMSPADFGWDGSTLLNVIFRAKNDINHNASTQGRILPIPARPAAPTGFTITEPTSSTAADGKLSGITNAMEYKTTGANWSEGTDAQLTGITAGTVYTIRVKATAAAFAGADASVTIGYNGGGGGAYIPPVPTTVDSGKEVSAFDLDTLASENKTLTVNGKNGEKLVLDAETVKALAKAGGNLVVTVGDAKGKLTPEQAAQAGDRPVYDLTAILNGKIVTNFDGKITVSLPYLLKEGENAEDVTVWYLATDGSMTEIPATYDPKTGLATFTVTHFSKYVVGVWVNPFTDVKEGAWYFDAVKYVHKKGMFSGVTATTFAPNASTTRAMLWSVLARQAGQDTAGGANWYEKARDWAIAKGVSDGTNPTGEITREQLVTMLWRYSGSPTAKGDLSKFTDADSVSAYAKQAMAWAVEKGIVSGTTATTLSPKSNAARAELASIIMRYTK